MKQSPPIEVAWPSTVASAAEAAIMASTRLPPRFRMARPAEVAAEWPDTTMARRPNTGARGSRGSKPVMGCSLELARISASLAPTRPEIKNKVGNAAPVLEIGHTKTGFRTPGRVIECGAHEGWWNDAAVCPDRSG